MRGVFKIYAKGYQRCEANGYRYFPAVIYVKLLFIPIHLTYRVIRMPGKFRKRDVERKGTEKEMEKEKILLDKNAEDLAHPEKLSQDYESESSPEESRETR